MFKQLLTVNRKKFATGIFWQPVIGGINAYSSAKQLAKNINKKYNLFVEYKNMIGLTNSRDVGFFTQYSAAAEIMEFFSEYLSFLAVFRYESNYYLIAVRNGIIIRDLLLESEEEARNLYTELSELPDWSALFAPASWGMPRAQERYLSDVIQSNSNVRLRQISLFKTLIPSLFFLGSFLLLIIYISSNYIATIFVPKKEVKINPELAAEYKRQIELKNIELDKQFEIEKIEPIKYPFDYLPDKNERAKLCYQAIGFVMQPIVGWKQTYVNCKEDSVIVNFVRDYGTLNDFYSIGNNLIPGAVVQELSDNEIMVRVKLPELQTYSSQDERDSETVVRDIVTLFQKANYNIEISTVVDNVTNGVDIDKVNVVEFSTSSKLIPFEFIQAFKDFDGVYMTSASWNMKTRIWNYEVIIYTK